MYNGKGKSYDKNTRLIQIVGYFIHGRIMEGHMYIPTEDSIKIKIISDGIFRGETIVKGDKMLEILEQITV